MKKTTTLHQRSRKLGIKRETLRQIDSLSPGQLAGVAGGNSGGCGTITYTGGSKYC